MSLSLYMTWDWFYTRLLYCDMEANRKREVRGKMRLCHQSIRELVKWNRILKGDLEFLPIHTMTPKHALKSDAAGDRYGGTLDLEELTAGNTGKLRE